MVDQAVVQAQREVDEEAKAFDLAAQLLAGQALTEASTDVHKDMSLREELLHLFGQINQDEGKAEIPIEEFEKLVIEQIANAFETVDQLNKYYSNNQWHDSVRDEQIRIKVSDAMHSIGMIKDKLQTQLKPLDSDTDALVKYSLTVGTEEVGSSAYQDKLAKLQKKITQFEAYLEEKDRTILEQETQLTEL